MAPDAQPTAPDTHRPGGVGTPPAGRYGRTADERKDRTLKIVGSVLGAVLLVVVAWAGVSYITGQKLSGRLITYQVLSDRAVTVHLEVVKDADATGVCTLRSMAEDNTEVGRKDVPIRQRHTKQVNTTVTIRTTAHATNAELQGCTASGS
ncbi:DUF4307 domain-containing protein [Streptomyces sp. NPDC059740]|uniref:DUF4307 domain-containing protein n=1 Tax=Streptomyces sp. NPDC059740 TaxID=3346926 RepID=UPI00364EA3DB